MDTADIRERVNKHVSDYDLINNICNFYGITDYDFFDPSHKQPGARAKKLYIFVAIRNLGFRNKDVSDKLGVTKSYVSAVMSAYTKRFKNKKSREKFSSIINFD